MDFPNNLSFPDECWLSVGGIQTYVLQIGAEMDNNTAIVIIPGEMYNVI